MATRFIDKEFGVNSTTAIANDATGRIKVQNLPDAAGFVYDKVDGFIKYNDAGTIRTMVNTDEAQALSNKTINVGVNTPITARAGGGQALATQLLAGVNQVTVVATAADSVKLPLAVAGQSVTVINDTATAMQVFGAGTDTINGIATATGISQAGNTVKIYTAITSAPAGNWEVQADAAAPGASQFTLGPVTVQAGDGALNPNLDATYVITKASAAALTLAAPTNPGSDGKTITVTSNTAFAHTITTATLLDTGTALTTSVVFAAFAGASVQLMAYAGRWKKISSNAVTHT